MVKYLRWGISNKHCKTWRWIICVWRIWTIMQSVIPWRGHCTFWLLFRETGTDNRLFIERQPAMHRCCYSKSVDIYYHSISRLWSEDRLWTHIGLQMNCKDPGPERPDLRCESFVACLAQINWGWLSLFNLKFLTTQYRESLLWVSSATHLKALKHLGSVSVSKLVTFAWYL